MFFFHLFPDQLSSSLPEESQQSSGSLPLPTTAHLGYVNPWARVQKVNREKEQSFTNVHGRPKQGSLSPLSHSTPSTLKSMKSLIISTDFSRSCLLSVIAQKKNDTDRMFTLAPYTSLYGAYREEMHSFAFQCLDINRPVRPAILCEIRGSNGRRSLLQALRGISNVFDSAPIILQYMPFRGIVPEEYATQREMLVWEKHSFDSWQSFRVFMAPHSRMLNQTFGCIFEDHVPLPCSVERQVIIQTPEEIIKNLDSVNFGWWPVDSDDLILRTLTFDEFLAYFPTAQLTDTTRVEVGAADRLDQQIVPVSRVDHVVPQMLLTSIRSFDPNLSLDVNGVLVRGRGKVATFITAEDRFMCPHRKVHMTTPDGKVNLRATWDLSGVATLQCIDPGNPQCADFHCSITPQATERQRWMNTFKFLKRFGLLRADFPITKSQWAYYSMTDIRKFFATLDPDWNFDTNFGYHPEDLIQPRENMWDTDFIEDLIGGELSSTDVNITEVLPYMNLFWAIIGKKVFSRNRSGYGESTFNEAKQVSTAPLLYTERTAKKKVQKSLLALWIVWNQRVELVGACNLPMLLDRFLLDGAGSQYRSFLNTLRPPLILSPDTCVAHYESPPAYRFVHYLLETALEMWVGGEPLETRQAAKDFLIMWIGRMFCQFGRASQVMVVLGGPQNTGKTSLANFLLRAVGEDNCHTPASGGMQSVLNEEYNDEFNKPLVRFDEVDCAGLTTAQREKLDNNVKALLTQDTRSAKRKHGSNSLTQICISNYIGATNNTSTAWIPGVSAFGSTNRRVVVILVQDEERQTAYLAANPFPCVDRDCQINGCVHKSETGPAFWEMFNNRLKDRRFLSSMIGYFAKPQMLLSESDKSMHMHRLVPSTEGLKVQQKARETTLSMFFTDMIELKRVIGNSEWRKNGVVEVPIDSDPNVVNGWIPIISISTLFSLFKAYTREAGDLPSFEKRLEDVMLRPPFRDDLHPIMLGARECSRWVWAPLQGGNQDRETVYGWVKTSEAPASCKVIRVPKRFSKKQAPIQKPLEVRDRDARLNRSISMAEALVDMQQAPASQPLRSESSSNSFYYADNTVHLELSGDEEPEDGEDLGGRAIMQEDNDDARDAWGEEYEENSFVAPDEEEEPEQPRKRKLSAPLVSYSKPTKVLKDKGEVDEVVLAGESE